MWRPWAGTVQLVTALVVPGAKTIGAGPQGMEVAVGTLVGGTAVGGMAVGGMVVAVAVETGVSIGAGVAVAATIAVGAISVAVGRAVAAGSGVFSGGGTKVGAAASLLQLTKNRNRAIKISRFIVMLLSMSKIMLLNKRKLKSFYYDGQGAWRVL